MRFAVLGPLTITDDDGHAIRLPGVLPRGVLATLLLNANQPVSLDRLIDTLWGEYPPTSVAAALRNHVVRLRHALGDGAAERIQTGVTAYRIQVEPGELDADDFARLCAEGLRAVGEQRWAEASASLTGALELWRGEVLADLPVLIGVEPHLRKLRDDRLLAYEGRIEADLHLGRHRELGTEIRGLISANPLHEPFHRQLMLALYRSGRRAEALEAYRELRRTLIQELGAEPSAGIQELHQQILNVDPALDVQPASEQVDVPAAPGPKRESTSAPSADGGLGGVFRQLPADLSTFTGREKELQRLIDAATRPHEAAATVVVSAIEGMAGVGKTQLAVHAAHRLVQAGRFDDVQLYANLHGFDAERAPADPAVVLEAFLRQLGVPARRIPLMVEERAAMFRDRLYGRASLILLDNVADEEQVRDLIPADAQSLVLLTSRRTLAGLDGAELHLLDVFHEIEAIELLARIAGHERVAAEPDAAAEIVRACGFLPLAVSLAACRLRARPAWTLADLVTRLDGILTTGAVGGRSLSSVFELSYRSLPETIARAFRLLGTYPGHDFTADTLAVLLGATVPEAESILEALLDEHLLQQRITARYEFHDLIAAFARQRGMRDESAEERDAAFERLMLWYAHAADNAVAAISPSADRAVLDPSDYSRTFDSRGDAMQWCEQELQNIFQCVAVAGRGGLPKLAWQVVAGLWAYFRVASAWDAWRDGFSAGLTAAEASGDLTGQASMHVGLGSRCVHLGEYDQALYHLQRAHDLDVERGSAKGVAITLNNIGDVHSRLGNFEAALDYLTRARAINTEDALDCIIVLNIGESLGFLGRYEEAERSLREVEARFLAKDDQYLAASTYATLGRIYLQAGELAKAEVVFLQAIAIRTTIGYRPGVAAALVELGETYVRTGRRESGREAWERALIVFGELEDQAGMEQVRGRLEQVDSDPA
ncbi:AfsR/SARP family transcriptional regulator [Catenulispora pinisilvae]|uniref:AfsR/SARP family transcriptional regulator n=1 Tax=Catenulispora pinisilvae TaxID=2705253 RepID=UPI0018910F46|nr:BTAD domain-containing putative transcriptional regulator [Catenulispora pinisilvae]